MRMKGPSAPCFEFARKLGKGRCREVSLHHHDEVVPGLELRKERLGLGTPRGDIAKEEPSCNISAFLASQIPIPRSWDGDSSWIGAMLGLHLLRGRGRCGTSSGCIHPLLEGGGVGSATLETLDQA